MKLRSAKLPFKPRARMMLLLGDQLIKDAGIAVFELVKNAYDADSPDVRITMSGLTDKSGGQIVIEDSGVGMAYETVTGVWLEPGTAFRKEQRRHGARTPKYGRLPLGEKGVGRFAAHKLGNRVRLVTRKRNEPEVVADVDWKSFDVGGYLGQVRVRVREREPKHFIGKKRSGTRIEVSELREAWNRGLARRLCRAVTAISSPFGERGDFLVKLDLKKHNSWLEGLLTVEEVLEFALYQAHCEIKGSKLSYTYAFVPYPAMAERVAPRQAARTGVTALNVVDEDGKVINLNDHHIGPVKVDLYVFDREPRILMLGVGDRKGLRDFLDESGGIRVYRDGIRVYNYGEKGDDWLNLGALRVNIPTQRISNNLVVGSVHLDAEKSVDLERGLGLIEKTNREGFVEGRGFEAFRNAVYFAVTQIEAERNKDKLHIRNAYDSKRLREPVLSDLKELRKAVEDHHLVDELGSYIDRIENDYAVIRDRFLTSASAGLSLAVVIHEVEKGVAELLRAVKQDRATTRIQALAKHLSELIEGFGALIRRSGTSRERASDLVSQALANMRLRLQFHKIDVTVDVEAYDFQVKSSRRLIISTIMNLVDNAIWWLDNKWDEAAGRKKLYIGTSRDFQAGPAIVIADNGPGFADPPEYLIQPFISRKPDGMGLGLHLADQVMKGHNGRLEFPATGDVALPAGFDGAVVGLVFPRAGQ